jgi:dihydrofolate reductase
MARTQYLAAATLDGYIADPDDGLGWLMGYESPYERGEEPEGESARGAVDAYMEGIGALVMGSTTYEFLLREAENWPYGERPSWVLTSRELPLAEGADVRFHDGPVEDIHAEMLEAAGDRDLWVLGGGPVASQLVDKGLLDDLLVTIVPVVLGAGKTLFEKPIDRPMKLVGTRVFDSGMVELRYELGY